MGRNTAIQNSRCLPFCCGREIPADEFATWTEIQRREYPISGMCNHCQDIAFAPFDEADFVEVDRPEVHDALPPESDDLDGDGPWLGGLRRD